MRVERPRCKCGAEILGWGSRYCSICLDLIGCGQYGALARRQAESMSRPVNVRIKGSYQGRTKGQAA